MISCYPEPRLTDIQLRALTAQVPIKKDTEILVNYMMTLAKSPEWYRVIWLQHMRKTKKDDAAIQRYIDRYWYRHRIWRIYGLGHNLATKVHPWTLCPYIVD